MQVYTAVIHCLSWGCDRWSYFFFLSFLELLHSNILCSMPRSIVCLKAYFFFQSVVCAVVAMALRLTSPAPVKISASICDDLCIYCHFVQNKLKKTTTTLKLTKATLNCAQNGLRSDLVRSYSWPWLWDKTWIRQINTTVYLKYWNDDQYLPCFWAMEPQGKMFHALLYFKPQQHYKKQHD